MQSSFVYHFPLSSSPGWKQNKRSKAKSSSTHLIPLPSHDMKKVCKPLFLIFSSLNRNEIIIRNRIILEGHNRLSYTTQKTAVLFNFTSVGINFTSRADNWLARHFVCNGRWNAYRHIFCTS